MLINAGLPVPPGFTVTAGAYRAHLKAANLVDRITSWIENAPIHQEIINGYEELCKIVNSPDLAVAVRSSATAEDLPTASFAGQQETYLGVREKSSVLIMSRNAGLVFGRRKQYLIE